MSSRMTSRLLSGRLGVSHNCRLTAKTSAPGNPLDCNGANSWAVRTLHQQIAEAGATVTSDTLPTVRGDDRLFRVFQNLIENGIKYRGERTPEIKLSARGRAAKCGQSRHRGEGSTFYFSVPAADRLADRLVSTDPREG